MQFTPQQLAGGPKFSHKTRVGNWAEDWEDNETKLKDYLKKKESGALAVNTTQQRYANALKRVRLLLYSYQVPHTYSQDGMLRFGDGIMLQNQQTQGVLCFDLSDKINSHEEAYSATTTDKQAQPVARNILIVEKADNKARDEIVRYGDAVKFVSNPHLIQKKCYLHSCPVSPQIFARFSRNQEVCLISKNIYNTTWKILALNPNDRIPTLGEPVQANAPCVIEHCATAHYLASDLINYRNNFGMEFEVCVHSYATKNKSQALQLEQTGKLSREQPTKFQHPQNAWRLVTASDPSAAEPVAEIPKYTAEDLLREIKSKLVARGSMSIRGLGRVFRILDDNRNRQIEPKELQWGLKDFGIYLDDEMSKAVLKHFDRDGSGTVDFNEFMRAIRGDLNETRTALIKKAYQKLDVNGDGLVKLDDVAQLYDVSQHPDVQQGKLTPEQAYRQFMSLWDTQVADGIVTFDEFCDYFRDVSASIDTDEYFRVMMINAWKIVA